MDIRTNKNDTYFDIWSPHILFVVTILVILSVSIGYIISIRYGILSSILILCFLGITTTNAWHKEFMQDGYAPISNLYSGYISAFFLFIGVTPIINLIIGGFISILISLFVTLVYSSIISGVAFRDMNEEQRKNAFKTYTGPSVVYRKDGPYIKHTEEVALSDREPLND